MMMPKNNLLHVAAGDQHDCGDGIGDDTEPEDDLNDEGHEHAAEGEEVADDRRAGVVRIAAAAKGPLGGVAVVRLRKVLVLRRATGSAVARWMPSSFTTNMAPHFLQASCRPTCCGVTL